jgi:hypothetical protein
MRQGADRFAFGQQIVGLPFDHIGNFGGRYDGIATL